MFINLKGLGFPHTKISDWMFQICFTVLCRPLAWYCLSDKTALLVSFSHEIPSLCYLIETFLFLCTVACKSDIQNSFVFTFLSKHKGVSVCTASFYCASLSYLRDKLEFNRSWYYSWKLKKNCFVFFVWTDCANWGSTITKRTKKTDFVSLFFLS